jgi:D-alanyl-lipoteichoic acid acyltransferase DltB (MBOAT superfamily)
MLFNSATYLVFLSIASVLCVWGPAWLRKGIFLFGSLAFYGFWRWDFLLLMVFNATIDYVAGRSIAATESRVKQRAWLWTSLILNFGLLAFFKYTYFILDNMGAVFGMVDIPFHVAAPSIILPLGISFYTFQSVSYTIDVYRGHQAPVKNYATFLTYVTFWPQLVAGPILRCSEVVPLLEKWKRPERGQVVYGIEEIIQGLFKKIVLADSIAPIVDRGFDTPLSAMSGIDVWTLAFAFGFQIYFDFSGYSQIALGSARVLGLHFPPNFNWPYLATSPREFWKRWHISLSSWIRDYLYLPLMGTRFQHKSRSRGGLGVAAAGETGRDTTPEWRRTAALFGTWFIMGLWHGANWTFAIWGVWHAALVWIHRLVSPLGRGMPKWLLALIGFSITLPLEMLAWVWFRAPTVTEAWTMVVRAFDPTRMMSRSLRVDDYIQTFAYLVGMLVVAGVHWLWKKGRVPHPARIVGLTIGNTIMLFFVFLMLRKVESFIYFQF